MPLSIFIFSGVINTITSLVLGVIAYFRNKRSVTHITFGLMSAAITAWSFCYVLWLLSGSGLQALFWVRLLAFFATLIPVFYLHWVLNIIGIAGKRKYPLVVAYFASIIFALISFSPYYIESVTPKLFFPFWPNGTIFYLLYIAFIYLGFCGWGFLEILSNYPKAKGNKKQQLRYILVGSLLGFGGGVTNFFLWFDMPIAPVGNLIVFLYVVIFGYTMLKHRLMDIRLIVVKSIVYFLLIVSIGLLYVLSIFVLGALVFKNFTGVEAYWASLAVALVVAFTFQPIRRSFTKWTEKIFFRGQYNFESLTSDLNEVATSTIILPELLFKFLNALLEEMRITRGSFILLEKGAKIYETESLGYKQTLNLKKDEIEHFLNEKKIEIFEEAEEGSKTKELMRKYNTTLILPLKAEEEIVGFLFLGEKKSGDIYSPQDLRVLDIITAQLSLGIQNAKAYEKIQKFNLILRAEINRATKELRDVNDRLIATDKSKDEFISLASHEIRTPIATLEGYLSMLNNQKLKAEEQKMISTRAYESVERLSILAKDLLDTSRIDQKRMKITKQPTRLERLIQHAVESFQFQAQDKGLYVRFKKPEKMLPEIKIDPDRISEVLNNLVGNALKYTEKGGVTISLAYKDKEAIVAVSDTGIGIPQKDVEHLFEKFYQAQSASSILSNERGGTGLGLYITRNIIEMHGGKIWVESKMKKGTTFYFSLPIE